MTREEMDRLIQEHITAEKAGDPAACVAMYTDDVEHDVVGAPPGHLHGTEAAQGFYDFLTANVSTEEMVPTRSSYGEDFCIVEHDWTNDPGRASGSLATGDESPSACCTYGTSATARSAASKSGSTAATSSGS